MAQKSVHTQSVDPYHARLSKILLSPELTIFMAELDELRVFLAG